MPAEPLRLRHFIGGSFEASEPGDWLPSLNPTRPEDVVAHVPHGGATEATAACAAAADAFPKWRKLTGPARAEFLYKWADAISARAEEMAIAIVREVGKPIGEAKGEVGRCVAILRYYAGEAVRPVGEVIPAQAGDTLQYSIREPLGVVGLITPWNFPVAIPLWKAAPALALGNTVVLKPAESSSFVATLLAETAESAGLPAGVFNVVFGQGASIGAALVESGKINALSFTGSGAVGRHIALRCTEAGIKYQTEMGGKNVAIVLADAALSPAANLVAGGAMRFAGQKCTATSRVVVERSVMDAFLEQLRTAIEALPVGDPGQSATAVGPVISERSRDSLDQALAEADAERFYEGSRPSGGYFIPPTVFTGVTVDSDLAQKELFGPVLAVIEAEDLDQALTLANSTQYGLSASLFTQNLGAAMLYVNRIEAGMVRVNADTTGVDPHAPFGGVKGSSSHTREQGPAARDFYTEIKTVQITPA